MKMTSGRERVCEYHIFFSIIIEFQSVCLKFSELPCCFEILIYQDSSILACYLVTLFQKVRYEHVMVQYRKQSLCVNAE